MPANGPTRTVRRYAHQGCGSEFFASKRPLFCPECGDSLDGPERTPAAGVTARGGFVVRRERGTGGV